MSMYNRYSFTKKVYPNYIILILKNNKYYSYGIDKKIIDYINFKDKLFVIKKRNINYLILDNLDIIDKVEYKDNMYDKYTYLVYLNKIFNEIKVVMSDKYINT